MRRPLDSYRVTGDTAEHAKYGVGPATDYAAPSGALPIGTHIKAPFPLSYVSRYSTVDGGLSIKAVSHDGRFEFYGQHLSNYVNNPGKTEGSVIAYSGNTGRLTTGPHLHCYVIADGKRISMEEFMQKYASGAAGGGGSNFNPGSPTKEENDMRAIHAPNKPWALVGPGYFRELNAEEAGNTIWPKHELNDRQWDLNRNAAAGPVATSPVGGMVVISDNANQRPVALVGPGYYRALNSEELDNVGVLADRRVVGNTRQFDLWVSMALAGQGASFPVGTATVDVKAVIDGVVKGLSDGLSDVSEESIRDAVREALNGATISARVEN